MSEHLKCPFCGNDVLIVHIGGGWFPVCTSNSRKTEFDGEICYRDITPQPCIFSHSRKFDTEKEAIDAFNTRYEPEPRVLTLEELKEHIGKPVYTVPIGGKCYAFWSIVDGWDISKDGSWWSDYGKTFICYDREYITTVSQKEDN